MHTNPKTSRWAHVKAGRPCSSPSSTLHHIRTREMSPSIRDATYTYMGTRTVKGEQRVTAQQTITLGIHCSRFGVSNTPENVECAHSVHTHTHTHTHTAQTGGPQYALTTIHWMTVQHTHTFMYMHKVGINTHKCVSCKPYICMYKKRS